MNEHVRTITINNYIARLPTPVVSYLQGRGTRCVADGDILTFRRQSHAHSPELVPGVSDLLASDLVFLNIYRALITPTDIDFSQRVFDQEGSILTDEYHFSFDHFLDACGAKRLQNDPFWSTYTDTLTIVVDFGNKNFSLAHAGKYVCDARTVSYFFKYR